MPHKNQPSPEEKPVGNSEETLPSEREKSHLPLSPSSGDVPTMSLLGGRTPSGNVAETLAATPAPSSTRSRNAGPTQIGEYEILSEIARGGMGVVYKARHKRLGRFAAIKLIKAGDLAESDEIKRFHAEAAAVSQLDHPHIVPVFEAGEYQGQQFMALAFVDGPSLWKRVQDAPLEPKEAAKLMQQVSRAIQYAHDIGIVHRDLKPQNILITADGTPKVTDFGLAKRQHTDSSLTGTGMALGTPSYMPPEQAAGRHDAVGPQSDVYSLGATLYALLTGRAPFQAASTLETLLQVMENEPVSPRVLNPAIPHDLETICLKCLRKEVGRRYASAAQLAEDLECWLEDKPIHARPVSRAERTWLWCKRRPALVGLSLAFFLLLLGGTLFAWERQHATQAAGLVAELESAETAQVPDILKRLSSYRRWANPLLRKEFNSSTDTRQKLHISLALLPVEAAQIDYLYEQLLVAQPQQVPVISAALVPHQEAVANKLWNVAASPVKEQASQRLRAASALALFDPNDERWATVQEEVGKDLVAVPAVHLGAWMEVLRPVRSMLIPSLSAIYRDRSRTETERDLATELLADYAADQPAVLANLLMEADPNQFAVIYPKFKLQSEQGLPVLIAELDKKLPPELPSLSEGREILAKRQANVAVALLHMDRSEKVWPLLKHSPDPRVRSYLIHCLSPLGINPHVIFEQLKQESDISIQRALILSLGEFREQTFKPDVFTSVVSQLQEIYRKDYDAGLHSAAEWVLRQWKQDAWLMQVNDEWTQDKEHRKARLNAIGKSSSRNATTALPQWYVNGQGQTMVAIPGPVEFVMGTPSTEPGRDPREQQHRRRIRRTFALGVKPVSGKEFKRFTSGVEIQPVTLRTMDHPFVCVDWYTAAKYCNWLSKEEGLAEDEWCYEIQGEKITSKQNYLTLIGYRLPSEAEMEYATRAGAVTARHYGEADDLLQKYGWYFGNSQGVIWPSGLLKPNDMGFFDLHGNVITWCQETIRALDIEGVDEVINDDEWLYGIESEIERAVRGGAHIATAPEVRSGYRMFTTPKDRGYYGIRVARTLVPEIEEKLPEFAWPADAPKPAIAPFDDVKAKRHQEEWAEYFKVPVEFTNSLGMRFRLIPPGEFMMGSSTEEAEKASELVQKDMYWQDHIKSELPKHKVVLNQPTYLSIHEVTQAEFERVTGRNPSHFGPAGDGKEVVKGHYTSDQPVEMVSWNDAAEFCAKLSEREKFQSLYSRKGESVRVLKGAGYHLPTEAQWEFACRAGTTTNFWNGDRDSNLSQTAWFFGNADNRTHKVGELSANPFGLDDMHGNVFEWVQDWWDQAHYARLQEHPAFDPQGSSSGTEHVIRGGNWASPPVFCRSSMRLSHHPAYRNQYVGFRVALSLEAVKASIAEAKARASVWPADAPQPAIAPFDVEQAKRHQKEWATYLRVPVEYTNTIGMKFRLIPPGEFIMGLSFEQGQAIAAQNPDDAGWRTWVLNSVPAHDVRLSQAYYLGTHEVTQEEYGEVETLNPSHFSPNGEGKSMVDGLDTKQHPVEMVSFKNAIDFCITLSNKEMLKPAYSFENDTFTTILGDGYRLPTEAQWEWACRGGTMTPWSYGGQENRLSTVAWYGANSGGRTYAVGQLNENTFGLHDMHGNVWELCQDWFSGDAYYERRGRYTQDPKGPSSKPGAGRAARGGSWQDAALACCSDRRGQTAVDAPQRYIGFRVLLSVDAVRERLKVAGPEVPGK